MKTPRDYQKKAINYTLNNGGWGFLYYHTQMGKTYTTALILKDFLKTHGQALIIAPKKLEAQWIEELAEVGLSTGQYKFVSIELLARKDHTISEFLQNNTTIIVCDEIQENKAFRQKVLRNRSIPKLGLSATPNRNDLKNWWYIAKGFFPNFNFIGKSDLREWCYHWCEIDNSKQWLKTYYPQLTGEWKDKDFSKTIPLCRAERDFSHQKYKQVKIEHESSDKFYIKANNCKFMATSSLQKTKFKKLEKISKFNYDGKDIIITSVESFILDSINNNEHILVLTQTPALARYISAKTDIACITGDTPQEDREALYKEKKIVATATCVGVGISSLHHIGNILITEKIDDQTLLTQIKGRNINHKSPIIIEIV